ncbi:MAG: hypothetical protein LW650_14030 [Planctomycetaceae bacterium]|jgi:hypothetical protein|nr:hypothetical protein [Planctomycetaceae bacterium]
MKTTRNLVAAGRGVASVTAMSLAMAAGWAQPVLISTSDVTLAPGASTIVDQASGTAVPLATAQITVRGRTLTVNGRHSIGSLTLEANGPTGALVTHALGFTFDYSGGAGTDVVNGMHLIIAGDLTITGSLVSSVNRIDVTARGFGSGQGPGAGTASTNSGSGAAGGGHGGRGSPATSFPGGGCYGEAFAPRTFGSGGGRFLNDSSPGGAGGGAVRLEVGGAATVNGLISAGGGGGTAPGGNGAGGSVWLSAGSIAGAGAIAADGVFTTGWGAGGGGRVVVTTSVGGAFGGAIRARGVGGNPRAGAGTVVTRFGGGVTTLTVDNGAPTGASQATELAGGVVNADVVVGGGVVLVPAAGGPHGWTTPGNFALGANTLVQHRPGEAGFTLTVGGNLTVATGGTISATGLGFASMSGPGAGQSSTNSSFGAAGGSHGGRGAGVSGLGLFSGPCYGVIDGPLSLGSGGGRYLSDAAPGGFGGGALRLVVSGNTVVDGVVTANGSRGTAPGGSGAGGSIWLSTGGLSGAGTISADGGSGTGWGAGGGGRIALVSGTSSFSGTVRAMAATEQQRAGAGTVYTKVGTQPAEVVIDNGYTTGGFSLPTELPAGLPAGNVTVRNFALVVPAAGPHGLGVSGNLTLGPRGRVSQRAGEAGFAVAVGGDLSIDSTSGITVAGQGFGPGQGPGAGQSTSNGSVGAAGGSHGGRGAFAIGATSQASGPSNGDLFAPVNMGSGGGAYLSVQGGSGGGAVRLVVGGASTINGEINASGASGQNAAGNGAGGSIWVTTGTLAGTGSIVADGANGTSWGAGGGGRIALEYASSTFGGAVSARGLNSQGERAGAGTIVTRQGTARRTVLMDNFSPGAFGRPTELPSGVYDMDLIVRNGVEFNVQPPDEQVLTITGELTVDNARLAPRSREAGFHFTAQGNATITATGRIEAVGRGFAGGNGPGAGSNSTSGAFGAAGGGHGGRGGDGGPFAGGQVYGSATQPTDMGSGGGSYSGNAGGSGGGAVRFTVGGLLTHNGVMIADGTAGSSAAGNGSGGSVWITAGTIVGNGSVLARGVNGSSWGPGGGGRIAIYSCNQPGTLTISAAGGGAGNGGVTGQAGSVFTTGTSTISISQQPQAVFPVGRGETTTLFVLASTSQPGGVLTYQWRKRAANGEYVNLTANPRYSGITSSQLEISNTGCSDGGVYSVLIGDSCGFFPSEPSRVSVFAVSDIVGIGGLPPGDGFVTGDDFIGFINAFVSGESLADICGIGGPPSGPDGLITGDDFNAFINDFASGCP